MILRLLLFALMGIGLAGFGLSGWRALHQSRQPPAPVAAAVVKPAPTMLRLLVAAHDLTPDSLLRPDDLASVSIAQDAAPANAQLDTAASRARLIGALIRRPIVHESVLDPSDLVLAGDHGFLATILKPGMRAFTISADEVVSNAGLIWPGDRLDLILTQQMPASMPPDRQISAETVLTDLRVLAIGHQLVQPPPADARSTDDNKSGAGALAVTVEVSPADAERLAVALRLGKVALAVRANYQAQDQPGADSTTPQPASSKGSAASPPTGTIWAGGVMHALTQIRSPAPAISVHVFEGDGDKEYKF